MHINNRQIDDIHKEKIFEILTFGFFLFMMIFRLMHSALWGDEWTEYKFSQAHILNGDLYRNIISTFQPPLYNFIMHFWLKAGTSIVWFRSFNIFLGFLSGIFLFRSLTVLYSRKTACAALCILAVCYQWIYCIQECSEYALMLCALFGALCFYILSFKQFTYFRMVMFVLCAIASIYSQYGAVFVALPLLLLFFLGNIFDKNTNKVRKIWIVVIYLGSFVIAALPLYFYFLRLQMSGNKITENKVSLTPELFMDFPFCLGKIIGYFFHLYPGEDMWSFLFSIAGFLLISLSVMLVVRKSSSNDGWVKKSLLICTWIGYFMHYLLVRLHIYAMTHPGESSGFYCRYSYFYLPLLCLAVPVVILEYKAAADREVYPAILKYTVGILCASIIGLSFCSTIKNWNKSLDNEFAKIWLEHNGWEDTTYLYGCAPDGFQYYISHSKEYREGFLDKATTAIDINNLPTRFWAWRTNWGGDKWQETIDKAKSLGYNVIIYNDSEYEGQLAYCSFDN